jgi:hypothetical protein
MARIVFVVGAARSGTTMLSRILNMHPRISTLNELHYFGDLWSFSQLNVALSRQQAVEVANVLFSRQHHGIWNTCPSPEEKKEAQVLVDEYESFPITGITLFGKFIETVAKSLNSDIICEQTPRNIFYAYELLKAYPNARVVQIIRDPRSVLASQKNRWKRRKLLNAKNIPWFEVIRDRVNYHPFTTPWLWKKAVDVGLSLKSHNNFFMLRFEDLANNPEKELKELCSFLEIDYSASMLDIPQIDSSSRLNDTNAKGISKDAVETWRKQLRSDEVLACEMINGKLMNEMGYVIEKPSKGKVSLIFQVITYPFHVFSVVLVNPRRAWTQVRGLIKRNEK